MPKKNLFPLLVSIFIAACFFSDSFNLPAQVFRGYYSSGTKQIQTDKRDKKNSIKVYYPNGKLQVIYEYENGKLNGKTRQYYENGTLKAEINYVDDKKHGQAKYYYDTGMLMARIEYANDLDTGVSRFYDATGKPIKIKVP
jgi:antitoxin component YwqK of YwqJK toxin-antitoxin module